MNNENKNLSLKRRVDPKNKKEDKMKLLLNKLQTEKKKKSIDKII